MKVHLVGGFSGSGKSTAVDKACEILAERNIATSVFKDDKADYVIAPLNSQNDEIASAKVADGCGCCNYYNLYFQINTLKKESDISTVFAEYSGTCTNLITSLLKPLRETFTGDIELANFSTFTDAGLLLMYLKGDDMPLSVEDKYTWKRHIIESEILIVNKTDLLSDYELEILQTLTKSVLGPKSVHFQNSTSEDSIKSWIEIINTPISTKLKINESSVAIAATGAMLDEEIEFVTTDQTSVSVANDFINSLISEISLRTLHIEDLHFILSFNGKLLRLSYPKLVDGLSAGSLTDENSDSVDLIVNARVRTSPEELRNILFSVLNHYKGMDGICVNEKFISYFQC